MNGRGSITGSARAGVDSDESGSPLQHSFGEALSRWASGVAVVATRNGSNIATITATSFTSVSLEPPLILVCVDRDSTVAPFLDEGERFGVSILGGDQRRLASMYADRGPLARDRFPSEGAPIVEGALAGLACVVHATHPGGDHRIVVAAVDRVEIGGEAAPLLYYRREYRTLD